MDPSVSYTNVSFSRLPISAPPADFRIVNVDYPRKFHLGTHAQQDDATNLGRSLVRIEPPPPACLDPGTSNAFL
jgi:hypothetical protein